MNIQQLNSHFGISNQITFIEGKAGLPFIKINNNNATALISIYAGQILSFQPVNEPEDLMFISENAYFQAGKAIKGGIPICWPWFGKHPDNADLPSHGFARTNFWSVSSTTALKNGDSKIKLEFVDTTKSRKIWPFNFYLSLEIVIGNTLTIKLVTRNTGKLAFSISEALHTYFKVGSESPVRVLGLEDTEYLDKTQNFIKRCQLDAITFSEPTDRIYLEVKHELLIDDPVLNRKIKISSSGNKNVVVWNPWIKGSAEIKDLKKDDYKHFVCVEIANAASNSIEILPGEEDIIITNYSVIRNLPQKNLTK